MKMETAVFEAAFGTSKQLIPSTLPEVVFSGRSNVGKSSMLNKLLNRKSLARVSQTPGKTITINFYKLDTVRLVDLPGYGYSRRAKTEQMRWAELMEGYFRSGRNIAMVMQLIDFRHPCSQDDITMLRFLMDAGMPFCVLLTKSDKLKKTERLHREQMVREELKFIPEHIVKIPFSAVTGEGVEEIKEIIRKVELPKGEFDVT